MENKDVQPQDNNLPPEPLHNDEPIEDFNMHDFLPPELQKAYDDSVEEEEPAPVATEPAQEPAQDITPITDNVDEIDMSGETLDALIDGDMSALNKPKVEDNEGEQAPPYWAEEEDYKALTDAINYSDFDKSRVDSLIQKVADKAVVDNSQLVNGLRKEIETAKRQLTTYQDEVAKGREAMRGINFDQDETVKSKYHQPLMSNQQKIDHVLRQEGAKINVGQVLGITNKATLLRTLEEQGVDEAKSGEILSEWRAYQDTFSEYNLAKQDAMKNAATLAAAKITPERSQTILKNAITDMIEHDEYNELKQAFDEGLDKHEDMSAALQKGRNNLNVILGAISNGGDAAHNNELLGSLAKYAMNAAYVEAKYAKAGSALTENAKLKKALTKVVGEYKTLQASAGGIQGNAGSPAITRAKAKEEEKSLDEKVKEFESMLESDTPFGSQLFDED